MTEKGDLNRSLVLMAIWHGGEFLMQDRTHKNEGIGFFGGRRKEHEKPADGAIREAVQETGLEIDISRVSELAHCYDDGWEIHAFQTLVAFDESRPGVPNPEGTVVYRTPVEAWREVRLMPATRAVLREIILMPDGPDSTGGRDASTAGE